MRDRSAGDGHAGPQPVGRLEQSGAGDVAGDGGLHRRRGAGHPGEAARQGVRVLRYCATIHHTITIDASHDNVIYGTPTIQLAIMDKLHVKDWARLAIAIKWIMLVDSKFPVRGQATINYTLSM